MQRIHCPLFLGCLLLLTLVLYGTKIAQIPREIETGIWNVSGHRELGIPLLTIVMPDPVPDPRPWPDPVPDPRPWPDPVPDPNPSPDPPENPKPTPL